jgi:hypothetical protein
MLIAATCSRQQGEVGGNDPGEGRELVALRNLAAASFAESRVFALDPGPRLGLVLAQPMGKFAVRSGQTKRCIQIADDQRRDATACDFNQPAVIWIVLNMLGDVSNAFVRDFKHREECLLGLLFAAIVTAEGGLGVDHRQMAARV